MKKTKKALFLFLLLLSLPAYSQNTPETYYADLVVIENSKFFDEIEDLIKDNECINRRADLILDYSDKSGYLLLWQSVIKNNAHIYKNEGKNIYATFLNNNPLFIVFKENDKLDLPIRETGYKINLSEYLSNYILVAHHLSYWYLQKYKDGSLRIIKEVLLGCEKSKQSK